MYSKPVRLLAGLKHCTVSVHFHDDNNRDQSCKCRHSSFIVSFTRKCYDLIQADDSVEFSDL